MLPLIPMMGAFGNLFMCGTMTAKAPLLMGVFLVMATAIYLAYGMKHSKLYNKKEQKAE